MRKLLITGGAGFIGTRLSTLALERGHKVRILDNLSPQVHGDHPDYQPPSGAEFVDGDIGARSDVERALSGVDTVVHLAAETGTGQSMYEIDRYYRVNVQGTALLLDVLANREHQVGNVILGSSRSVYGEGAYLCRGCEAAGALRFPGPRTPRQLEAHEWALRCPKCGAEMEPTAAREDHLVSPASIYAATKLAQEQVVGVACRSLGIAHAILRFQNVFGEGQSLTNPYTGILSIFSTRLRQGRSLPVFEDGEETRDFVHVDDVAEVLVSCIERPVATGITLNVGSGRPASIMTVARLLAEAMGSVTQPHITGEFRVGDIRHNFADISALESTFGFTPAISLEEGIGRFAEWVKTQPLPEDLLERANAELKARKLMA